MDISVSKPHPAQARRRRILGGMVNPLVLQSARGCCVCKTGENEQSFRRESYTQNG